MEELAALGASVHTCARSAEDLKAALAEWQSRGFEVSGTACDVSKAEGRQALLQDVEAAFKGKLDILVSSAPPTRPPKTRCINSLGKRRT